MLLCIAQDWPGMHNRWIETLTSWHFRDFRGGTSKEKTPCSLMIWVDALSQTLNGWKFHHETRNGREFRLSISNLKLFCPHSSALPAMEAAIVEFKERVWKMLLCRVCTALDWSNMHNNFFIFLIKWEKFVEAYLPRNLEKSIVQKCAHCTSFGHPRLNITPTPFQNLRTNGGRVNMNWYSW